MQRKKPNCLFCGEEVKEHKSTFCSRDCNQKFNLIQRIHSKTASPKTIKKYLIYTGGNKCQVCGITDWNGKPIVMELEHIDGNSDNNELSNVCLICPNCHSQTDTYKGANRGNGRYYRRMRYKEGKSF